MPEGLSGAKPQMTDEYAQGMTDDLMGRALAAFRRRAELSSLLADAKSAFDRADGEFSRCVTTLRQHLLG